MNVHALYTSTKVSQFATCIHVPNGLHLSKKFGFVLFI